MKALIKGKTEIFKNLFKTTSTLIPEARFTLTKESLGFRGMGLSHIDMLDATFPASDFETFEVDEKIFFGVRLEDVLKLVNNAGDTLELSLNGETSDRITIKSGRKKFDSRLIEAEEGKHEIPKIDFTGKIAMTHAALNDAFSTIAVQSEHVFIEKTGDKALIFYGEGDTGRAEIEPETISVEGAGRSSYNLLNLKKLTDTILMPKGSKTGENALIQYGTNMPIVLTIGRISYFHAPRVEQA
jgi:DNA polymerase III sliding clamp (beta) subunit (PCNA family)